MLKLRQIGLVGLFGLMVIIANWQGVEDWLNLPLSPPSPVVEHLAIATTMTRPAQRIFYRQVPSIESQQSFLNQCKVPDQTIILGCYMRENGVGKIVIQQVSEPRLQGMMEVTAAHEMLHAAYIKLSLSKREELAAQLQRAAKRVTDKRLLNVLKTYETKDVELYRNELHSHLGTELADLGDPALEAYYQRYFSDRQRVVVLAQASGRALKELEQKAELLKPEIDQLEAQLNVWERQLEQAKQDIKTSSHTLDAMKADLEATQSLAEAALQRGDKKAAQLIEKFERQKEQFNQQVARHNSQIQAQNEQVAAFNEKVKIYKQTINDYNQVARESRTLLDSLKGKSQHDPQFKTP